MKNTSKLAVEMSAHDAKRTESKLTSQRQSELTPISLDDLQEVSGGCMLGNHKGCGD